MKLHCVKCGHVLPKDEGAKSLLPFEVYRCQICGDGFLLDAAAKQAYLIPKSLGLFNLSLKEIKEAIREIPYNEDY